MDGFWRQYGVSAIALVLIGVAFFAGLAVGEKRVNPADQVSGVLNKYDDPLTLNSKEDAEEVDFAPFWRVWNVLNNKFVPRGTSTDSQIDPQDKVWHAISGLVATYDDPYTIFLPPEESEAFKENAQGSFEGVGMVVGANEAGRIVVIAPLEDSPAMKAGLEAGDIIETIDGEDASGLSVEEGVTRIRGEKGTNVTIGVIREGEEEELSFTVTRGNIDIPSTSSGVVTRDVVVPKEGVEPKTKTVTDEETGETKEIPVPIEELPAEDVEEVKSDFFVLRLFSFSQSSMKAFEKGLKEFSESGTNKLIIDLRGNPGGFLNAAVDISSYFLPRDTLVVKELFGADQEEREHLSVGHDLLSEREDPIELVILIDRGSASASEIVAGALSEYGKATLIGEKSFGKGSVQELIDITGDISLKVTIARWYTPLGVSISETGLEPDIVVDVSNAVPGEDEILDRAIEYLSTK